MEIILDGKKIKTKDELFIFFKDYFQDLYGNNLDALFDTLSYHKGKLIIKIINYQDLKNNLGDYVLKLENLFLDLKDINNEFKYEIVKKD